MGGALRHDFVRTMTSRSVVLSMAVLIALSFALVPLIGIATSPGVSSQGGTAVLSFYSGSEYRFVAYSYNTYGQPVIGTSVNVTVNDAAGTRSSAATTNSSGLASWTLQAGSPETQVSFSVMTDDNVVSQGVFPPGMKSGEIFSIGGSSITTVVNPADSSKRVVLFVYEGPNGTLPTMYRVYYSYASQQTPGAQVMNITRMTLLGAPTSFVNTFDLPPAPRNATQMNVGAFESDPPYNIVSGFSEQTVGGSLTPPSPSEVFSSFVSAVLAIAVPLMAIMVAYNSYGKDRATGVIESVLSRPVTRRSLGLSRYLSFVLAGSVALIIMISVVEAISLALLGVALPANFALSTTGSLIVEVAAFTGIVMLISQVIRSQGNMILVGVGLWIMLDLFWTVAVFFASAILGIQIGSGNYLALTIQSSFFNPAQFYSLVGEYLNGVSVSTGTGGSIPISPATYGLSPLTLSLTAAVWILVPLLGFLYLVARRD